MYILLSKAGSAIIYLIYYNHLNIEQNATMLFELSRRKNETKRTN